MRAFTHARASAGGAGAGGGSLLAVVTCRLGGTRLRRGCRAGLCCRVKWLCQALWTARSGSERDRGTGCSVRGAAGLRRDRRRSGNVSGFGMPGAASCPQRAGPGDPALMAATSVPGRSGQGGLGLRSAEHRPRWWMRKKKKTDLLGHPARICFPQRVPRRRSNLLQIGPPVRTNEEAVRRRDVKLRS